MLRKLTVVWNRNAGEICQEMESFQFVDVEINHVFTHGVFVSREVLVLPQMTKKSIN